MASSTASGRSSFFLFWLLFFLVGMLFYLSVPCSAQPDEFKLDGFSPELQEMILKAQKDAKNRPQTEAEIIAKLKEEADMRAQRSAKNSPGAPGNPRVNPRESRARTPNRPPPKVANDDAAAPAGAASANTAAGVGGAGAAQPSSSRPSRPRPADPRAGLDDEPRVAAAKAEAERRREAAKAKSPQPHTTVIGENGPPPPRPGSESVEERRRLIEERRMRKDHPDSRGGVRGGQYPTGATRTPPMHAAADAQKKDGL